MKKVTFITALLLSCFVIGQEKIYHIYNEDYQFVDYETTTDGSYFLLDNSSNKLSIKYNSFNNTNSWTKDLFYPVDYTYGIENIAKCNLSNNLIISLISIESNNVFVIKITPDGNVLWSKKILMTQTLGYDYGSNISPLKINGNDEITITITPYNSLGIIKLDTNGNVLFSKNIQNAENPDGKNPGFFASDSPDNGYIVSLKVGSNPCIVKLDEYFNVNWAKKWTIDSYSHPKITAVFPNGNYCVIGYGDNGNFIDQIDPSGNILSYKYGISFYSYDQLKIIDNSTIELFTIDGFHYSINLSTNFVNIKNFVINPGIPKIKDDKLNFLDIFYNDLFLNLESTEMNCITPSNSSLILQEQILLQENVEDVLMNVSDIITNVSNFSHSIVTSNSNTMEQVNCSSLNISETNSSDFDVYPNPVLTNQTVNIHCDNNIAKHIEIISLSGQIVFSKSVQSGIESIDLSKHKAGVYFIQILDSNQHIISTEKLIIN